jgi:hypothetical protein
VIWRGGVFSGTYTDRWELPDFDGGYLINASLGYDMGKKGQVRLDYLYNDGDRRNFVATKPYEHSLSLNYNGTFGRLGLTTDLIYAAGSGEVPDVWGIVLMPYYKSRTSWRAFSGTPTPTRTQKRHPPGQPL